MIQFIKKLFGLSPKETPKTEQELLQDRKLEILEDTINYYSPTPSNLRCNKASACFYSGVFADKPNSDGCAIGRLLTPELRLELDRNGTGGINEFVMMRLPEDLQLLGEYFLGTLQRLHDGGQNWLDVGLSDEGKEFAENMRKQIKANEI